ncbi:winged helix-turn-helix transcriptional regulator [Acetobacteraceae bacterium]|nr:winged helix-turn-helix transcriptional regulator [Acetobacteraceae bacterium]
MNESKADKLTNITLSVFKLNGQLIEWGNYFSHPHGLTSARWQILSAISLASQPPNIPQIAATMSISRQAVLKQIKPLIAMGFIEVQTNPTHKRSPLYTLTEQGKSTYQALNKCWNQHVQKMVKQFNSSDLDAVIQVLSALSEIHIPIAET